MNCRMSCDDANSKTNSARIDALRLMGCKVTCSESMQKVHLSSHPAASCTSTTSRLPLRSNGSLQKVLGMTDESSLHRWIATLDQEDSFRAMLRLMCRMMTRIIFRWDLAQLRATYPLILLYKLWTSSDNSNTRCRLSTFFLPRRHHQLLIRRDKTLTRALMIVDRCRPMGRYSLLHRVLQA